jgi:rhamnulose-1-phosphate aldolase
MKVLESAFAKRFIRMCSDGYMRGWHERNGGNLSYRLTDEEVASVREEFAYADKWFPIGAKVPSLANEHFLVKCTGVYMMNVALDPLHSLGIIQLDKTGEFYRIVFGMLDGRKPTSELPSHLMNLAVLKERTNGAYRVVYHCHATNVIALTFVLPLNDKDFSHALWEMATECSIVFPAGVGVVPWMVPGGEEIALATSHLMKSYDAVVWAHHGLFAAGSSFDEAWGLVDTIEKSAEILVKVLSMGGKRQTISDDDLKKLDDPFGVCINPNFLNK